MTMNLRNDLLPLLVLFLSVGGCAPGRAPAEETASREMTASLTSASQTSTTKGNDMTPRYSKSGYDITPLPRQKVAELASKLDPEAYEITQQSGTERPFCSPMADHKEGGLYACAVCGLPLFSSEHKFHSGTGWPSFFREVDPEHVSRRADRSHGMDRTEINCARCNSHLGHVFEDGPRPTGERHCVNSASLTFHPAGSTLPPESRPMETETAYFAGGCFWGMEHYFQLGPGVINAVSGYMQGKADNPTYKQVCSDSTGHAETVKVVFDPKRISYRRLLGAFFAMHDPTQLNRQGPDVGSQYRSGIWYVNERQKQEAEAFIKELEAKSRFGGKIVTQVDAARTFYPAEEYHQDYIEKTGGVCHVNDPWTK